MARPAKSQKRKRPRRAGLEGPSWFSGGSHGFWLALSGVLAAFASLERLTPLLEWPVAAGRDGYYYIVQITNLLHDGRLFYPSPVPLPFYLLAVPTALAGDPIIGAKIGVAALSAAAGGIMGELLYRWTESGPAALVGVLWLTTSPLHDYFFVEFARNLCGLAGYGLLVLGLTFGNRSPFRPTAIVLVAVGFATSWASHLSAAVIATLTVLVYAAGRLTMRQSTRPARTAFLACCTLGLILILGVGSRVVPGFDWRSVSSEFELLPSLSLFRAGFPIEMIKLCAIGGVALVLLVRVNESMTRKEWALLGALTVSTLVLVLNPWARYDSQLQGVMARMQLWALFFASALVGILVGVVLSSRIPPRAKLLAISIALLGIIVVDERRYPGGARLGFLSERLELRSEMPRIAAWLPGNGSVVAEHGYQFMVTAETGRYASARREATDATTHYWLLRTPPGRDMRIPAGTAVLRLRGWTMLREDLLMRWLADLDDQDLDWLSGQNPFHLARDLLGRQVRARTPV